VAWLRVTWTFLLAMNVFVLFLLFLVDRRNPETALCRQVAEVMNNSPHLIVAQNAFPGGHSGWADAIVDNRLQLAVRVVLDVFRRKVGNRRVHFVGERNAGTLAVEPMTDPAMVTEMLPPFGNIVCGTWQGIRNLLPAHGHLMFHFLGNFSLDVTRLAHTAAADEQC